MTDPEHRAVDAGFVCENCGTTRLTPLGISRHREQCNERAEDTEEE